MSGVALTLEDHDHRIAALEAAQSARSEHVLVRIEQKVDALHRVTVELIAESEQRMRAEITESELRMGARITEADQRMRAETQRILTVVNAAEQRTAGLINDSEQRILVALDRLKNP
jgi:hypothetical protein